MQTVLRRPSPTLRANPFDFSAEEFEDDDYDIMDDPDVLEGMRLQALAAAAEDGIKFKTIAPGDSLAEHRREFWSTPIAVSADGEYPPAYRLDIFGLKPVLRTLDEIIELTSNWADYHKDGMKMPSGALLYGEPGNGKTLSMRYVASNARGRCYDVREFPLPNGSWDEDDIKALYNGAREVSRANDECPIILLWDEIDAYLRKNKQIIGKDQVASALCAQMDGLKGQKLPIFLLCTANFKNGIEEALLRSGRISIHAECLPLNAEDGKEFLIAQLTLAKLPIPPQKHLEDLLGDSNRSASDISEAVTLARMRLGISKVAEPTTQNIARYLIEQMMPIPSDKPNGTLTRDIALHELGHALIAHALGLRMQLINIWRVYNQEGSIVLSAHDTETQLDTFCYMSVAVGGRLIESRHHGKENVSVYRSEVDYQSVVECFLQSYVQSGGHDGRSFDWRQYNDVADTMAEHRARELDLLAVRVMDAVVSTVEGIYDDIAGIAAGVRPRSTDESAMTVEELFAPFLDRLCDEGIILGSDAFDNISSLLGRPCGWYRTHARDHWASLFEPSTS